MSEKWFESMKRPKTEKWHESMKSSERSQKLSEATSKNWHDEKYRKHMVEVHKGYEWTDEIIKKRADSLKSRQKEFGFTEMEMERHKKISESRKGMKFSEEHLKNLSLSHIGLPGNPHTEESKSKLRQARLNQIMPSVSACEKILEKSFVEAKLNVVAQFSFEITQMDFAIPRSKIAIYMDGCYWHSCPEHFPNPNRGYLKQIKGRDKYINEFLRRAGWKVLRFWEHEIINPNEIINKIKEVLLCQSQ